MLLYFRFLFQVQYLWIFCLIGYGNISWIEMFQYEYSNTILWWMLWTIMLHKKTVVNSWIHISCLEKTSPESFTLYLCRVHYRMPLFLGLFFRGRCHFYPWFFGSGQIPFVTWNVIFSFFSNQYCSTQSPSFYLVLQNHCYYIFMYFLSLLFLVCFLCGCMCYSVSRTQIEKVRERGVS